MKQMAYLRVSTKEQHLDRQIQEIIKFSPSIHKEDIYMDKESGTTTERSEYKALKRNLRNGDVLIIPSLDRLARSKKLIKQELEWFQNYGVQVKILNIPTTLIDMENNDLILELITNLIIEIYSTFAQADYEERRERQASGILHAKNRGIYKGRKPIPLPNNFAAVYQRWKDKQLTAVEAMKLVSMGPSTFYRKVKQYESKFS